MSCPRCGYCEHCGRSNYTPYYNNQPWRWPYNYLTNVYTSPTVQSTTETFGYYQACLNPQSSLDAQAGSLDCNHQESK